MQNPRQLKNYRVDQSESSHSESESDSEDEKEADGHLQIKSKTNNISLNEKNVNADYVNNIKSRKPTRGASNLADKSITLSSEQEENLENEWSFTATMPRRSERKIIEESKKNATPVSKNKTNESSENTEKSNKKRNNRNDWKDLAPFLPERNLRSKKHLDSDAKREDDRTDKFSNKSRKNKKMKEEKYEDEVKTAIVSDDGLMREVQDLLSTPSEAVSLDSSELTEIKNDDTSEEADNDSNNDFKGEPGIKCEIDKTKMDVDEDNPCMSFEPTIYVLTDYFSFLLCEWLLVRNCLCCRDQIWKNSYWLLRASRTLGIS